jgi:hypothetical protein
VKLPRLEIEKDPPWYSSGLSFPARARPARSLTVSLMSLTPRLSALVTIGVINPFGVATSQTKTVLIHIGNNSKILYLQLKYRSHLRE